MEFEFDEAKSEANKAKHKIDFFESQKLWQDVDALEVPARTAGTEARKLLLARHAGKLWAAVFTERAENVRIISVRRARANEEAKYEQANTDTKDDGGES